MRALAVVKLTGTDLMDLFSRAAICHLTEFDLQGSANTAWALSTVLLADSSIFPALADLLLSSLLLDTSMACLDHVANELTHVCQLVWAFSFASCLSQRLGQRLYRTLIDTGARLDCIPVQDLVTGPPLETRCKEMTPGGPTLAMDLDGISVVFKPPYWEVDAKGQLSRSGLYLSKYLQAAHPASPVLRMARFEYGFIHRLDVPSSGLILAGTTFRGLAALQWQMHTYSICPQLSKAPIVDDLHTLDMGGLRLEVVSMSFWSLACCLLKC